MRYPFLAVVGLSIASTSTANADSVELVTGDLLHGTVVEQTDSAVVLDHPVMGNVTLPVDQVKAVVVTDGEGGEVLATPEPEPEPVVDTDSLSHKILPGWDKNFELGFNGSEGNSQTLNIHSAFDATQEDDHHRWKLGASFFQNKDDGTRTRNEFNAEVTHDWLMPDSDWFKFATAKYQYDEFQDWESRASAFIGVGKQLKKTDEHDVIGRVGIGGSYEFGSVNEIVPEALLGLEWVYTINERQTLASHVTVFPDLDEFGESRTVAGVAWTLAVDEADGISLKFGVDNEYESSTEGNAKHNDVKYYGALVFDF